jgi:diadenosine tetraphosphate (Ap4A) HIT family hydrolase
MSGKIFDDNCKGCRISQKCEDVLGGIVIELNGDWTLNHYGGPEGYLGWLALQPRYHRNRLTDLSASETAALGGNIQDIDRALSHYWEKTFKNDPIKRVYVVYFYESVFDKPDPTPYHLHIHLIPRTQSMDTLLRKCKWTDSEQAFYSSTIVAWNIHKITEHDDFPTEYICHGNEERDERKVQQLMTDLQSQLQKRGCIG